MRRLWVGLVSVVMVVGLIAAGVVTAFLGGTASNQAWALPCLPTSLPAPSAPGDVTSPITPDQLDSEQISIANAIITIGKQRELPPRAWQVALQAGMTESKLRNLDHGDRDSVGIFQMRTSMGWGTIAQLQDVEYQVNAFYGGPEYPPPNTGLLDLPNWEQMRPGDAAQAVERSAFPERYHVWESLATALIGQLGGVENPSGCDEADGGTGGDVPAPTEAAGQAIKWALKQLGKPYVWGATGPDSFDCSGLMLRAYESAGGLLPRVSRQQFHAGAHLPVADAMPGDMLFWAYDPSDPRTIHHVAMYLGGGQMVEAQQSGVPVHIRPVSFDEGGMVPIAVRPSA